MQPLPLELNCPAAGQFPERDLRCELAEAIVDREAADKRARAAREIADRADRLKREVGEHAERLKTELEAAQRAATHRHAKTISDALRAGSEPPCGI